MQAKVLKTTLFSLSLAVASMVLAENRQPDATVTIDETQVMLILGGDHGHGTLTYQGNEYKFKASGLKVGGVGIHKMDMTGEVYDLKSLDDFTGLYFEAEAGADLVKGKGFYSLKNDKGTILHLKSKSEGLALSVGVEGFDVKFVD